MTVRSLSPALVALLVVLPFLAGCDKKEEAKEIMYVSQPEVSLRDRVAAVYSKVGTVKNGDRVEILGKDRRFARVRSPRGEEGWMEMRYLVEKAVFDQFEQLRRDYANAPSVGTAVTRAELNMHVTPGRETPKLYRLAEAEKVQMLKRDIAERPSRAPAAAGEPPPKIMEDWWLVRNAAGQTGWVLGRIIDLDVPLEVAQYAEGQRIVSYYVLNEVEDEVRNEQGQLVPRKVPQILMLLNEPKDGIPHDYNQARVFTWNSKRDRYETAYRERKLVGMLPVTTGFEQFGNEGRLPFFTLRLKDVDGNLVERKYKMNGVMVRRVLAPGEEPAKLARPAAAKPAKPRR